MREVPQLVKLSKEYRSRGLAVVGVTGAERSGALAFATESGVDYPLLVDAGADVDAFEVLYVPATFLIDGDGRIVAEGMEKIEERLAAEFGG